MIVEFGRTIAFEETRTKIVHDRLISVQVEVERSSGRIDA